MVHRNLLSGPPVNYLKSCSVTQHDCPCLPFIPLPFNSFYVLELLQCDVTQLPFLTRVHSRWSLQTEALNHVSCLSLPGAHESVLLTGRRSRRLQLCPTACFMQSKGHSSFLCFTESVLMFTEFIFQLLIMLSCLY